MPELPEVETTCAGIRAHIVDKQLTACVVRQASLRWPVAPDLADQVVGRNLRSVTRRAKYILLNFDTGILAIHLGMSGSLRVVESKAALRKHDHVDLIFSADMCLRFHDPRRFGAIIWIEGELNEHALFSHLGPEPLSDDFDGDFLFRMSRKRKVAIKQFVMNAQVVVGVGNIYANEALFSAGIHPTREAGSVSKKRYEALALEIKQVLSRAIQQGGTTLRDFVNPEGSPGYFVQSLQVYGRKDQPCPTCKTILQELRLNNRSTVFCGSCQS